MDGQGSNGALRKEKVGWTGGTWLIILLLIVLFVSFKMKIRQQQAALLIRCVSRVIAPMHQPPPAVLYIEMVE